jgi:hypothetical protein
MFILYYTLISEEDKILNSVEKEKYNSNLLVESLINILEVNNPTY